MKKLFIAAVLALLSLCSYAQIQWTWEPVPMDSKWDEIKDPAATLRIAEYEPFVGPLQEIICYSKDEYTKRFPESGLSNMAADVVRLTAEKFTGEKYDIGLTNFGGIRTSLPKGAVRVYDIFSIFPFDNDVVVFDIKGSNLRKVLMQMIRRGRIEALSNVEIVAENGEALKLNVDGAPIDDNRIYKFATINFLMDGGDGIKLVDVAMNYQRTGIYVRDAIVDYLREVNASGKVLELVPDGRVISNNTGKK